jgi:hypothetical protein
VVIDQAGLLQGDRIRACSDDAQLHFPRLLVASNRLGRLEMNYPKLLDKAYAGIRNKPTREQITQWLREYHDNFLLFVYRGQDGSTWGQWHIPKHCLPLHPTNECKRSPTPPQDELAAFQRSYVEHKQTTFDSSDSIEIAPTSQNFAEVRSTSQDCEDVRSVARGIGIGIGSGKGVGKGIGIGKDIGSEPTGSSPIAKLPTNKTGEYFLVKFDAIETWKRLYPAVDIEQELRNIEGWLLSNPQRRKTERGMPNFITTWLSKEQDKGGRKPQGDIHAQNQPSGRKESPSGARNRRSNEGIDAAFEQFGVATGAGAGETDQSGIPAAGDSARNLGAVDAGMDRTGDQVRDGGAGGGPAGSHPGVIVLPHAGGAKAAHRGAETRAG